MADVPEEQRLKTLTETSPTTMLVISSDGAKFMMDLEKLKVESRYFHGLLNSGMVQTQNYTVQLQLLPERSLQHVDDFICGQQLCISRDDYGSVLDTLIAADYLTIPRLLNQISEMLMSWISPDTFDQIKDILKDFCHLQVYDQMNQWLFENTPKYLLHGESFLHRSYEEAKEMLSSDELMVKHEMEVVGAGLRWMERNGDSLNDGLVLEARACLMDRQTLEYCVKLVRQKKQRLLELSKFIKSFKSPEAFYNAHLGCQKRAEKSFMVALGGSSFGPFGLNQFKIVPIEEVVSLQKDPDLKFQASEEKLPKSICHHCVCVLRDDIYIIGGQEGWRNYLVHRFNTSICQWQLLQSLWQGRSRFYCGVVRDRIYAVGGWCNDKYVSKTVEQYDPQTNRWRYVQDLDEDVHYHAGSVLNEKIFISGGYRATILNEVHVFDPPSGPRSLGKWRKVAPMQVSRSQHAMVPVKDKGLLVAGGYKYNENNGNDEYIYKCEFYDVALDQWTLLDEPLPYTGKAFGCMMYANKLFLVGGRCSYDGEEAYMKIVQVLDTESWQWTVGKFSTELGYGFTVNFVKLQQSFAKTFKRVADTANSDNLQIIPLSV